MPSCVGKMLLRPEAVAFLGSMKVAIPTPANRLNPLVPATALHKGRIV